MEAKKITICMGSSCYTRGNNELAISINEFLKKNNLLEKVNFSGELCSCNCKKGPNIKIEETSYENIDFKSAIALIRKHFQINIKL